jgi:hypothetical protein
VEWVAWAVLAVGAWFALSVPVALVVGRVVRLREECPARPPTDETS